MDAAGAVGQLLDSGIAAIINEGNRRPLRFRRSKALRMENCTRSKTSEPPPPCSLPGMAIRAPDLRQYRSDHHDKGVVAVSCWVFVTSPNAVNWNVQRRTPLLCRRYHRRTLREPFMVLDSDLLRVKNARNDFLTTVSTVFQGGNGSD